MTFPKNPHLAVGTGTQVGILTLWTKKEHVMARVPEDRYAVISQLYSRDEGVSMLLRSLLAHKEIRDLIMVGADLNGCSDALLALWNNGVDNGEVVGAPGYVDPEIPSEAIDRLRDNVRLHDKRGVDEYVEVKEFIDTLEPRESWGEPESFPEPVLQPPERFPYASQHVLRHERLRDALIDLAKRAERIGELRNVQLQLSRLEDLADEEETRGHVESLRDEIGEDQKETFTIHPSLAGVESVSFEDTSDALFVSAHLTKTPLEKIPILASALVRAGRHVAHADVVLTLDVTRIQPDAHAHRLAQQPLRARRGGDPASNMLIRLRDGEIEVTHLSPEGKRLEQFSDTSGQVLYQKIVGEFRVSDLGHAAYLGYELGKAEYALKNGGWYEQDLPLRFEENDES